MIYKWSRGGCQLCSYLGLQREVAVLDLTALFSEVLISLGACDTNQWHWQLAGDWCGEMDSPPETFCIYHGQAPAGRSGSAYENLG